MGRKAKIPHKNFNNHKKFPRLSNEDILQKYPNVKYIVGFDEVGYGACAGSCNLGCVVLPINSSLEVKDSKKYSSERARRKASDLVKKEALWYKVVKIPAYRINEIGLGKAKNEAMIALLEEVLSPADYKDTLVVVDGSYIPPGIPTSLKNFKIIAVPKADERIKACSAASVVAKVERDDFMTDLSEHEEFSHYDFAKNKGYLTAEHMAAIKQHGVSSQHRLNVKPIKDLLNAKKTA